MRWIAPLLLAPLLVGLAPFAAAARNLDRIAAVVNEQPILLSEVEERAALIRAMAPPEHRGQLLHDALEDLVADKLFQKQVKELNLEVGDAEVQAAIDDVMRQNGFSRPDQLEEALRSQGLSVGEYRTNLKSQLSQMKLLNLKVRSKIRISDDDVKRRFAELSAVDAGEEEVHARHVLVRVAPDAAEDVDERAREKAATIAAQAQSGEDFAKLAKEASEGASGEDGGDLGWFRRGEMTRELEVAAFHLQPGQISDPVKTKFGWHVLQVMERRAVTPAPLEEQAPELRERLFREELDRQTARYLDELKKNAVIEYRIPELQPRAR